MRNPVVLQGFLRGFGTVAPASAGFHWRGQIRRGSSGGPVIAGAAIGVQRAGYTTRWATADSLGRFRFDGLAAGRWTIRTTVRGFVRTLPLDIAGDTLAALIVHNTTGDLSLARGTGLG